MASASFVVTQIVTSGAMASDITSTPVKLQKPTQCSIECVWSGGAAPVGTLQVQASNSYELSLTNPTLTPTWHNVSGASNAVSATPGTTFFDLGQINAAWVRLFYDATSGSGTLNAYLCAKSEG